MLYYDHDDAQEHMVSGSEIAVVYTEDWTDSWARRMLWDEYERSWIEMPDKWLTRMTRMTINHSAHSLPVHKKSGGDDAIRSARLFEGKTFVQHATRIRGYNSSPTLLSHRPPLQCGPSSL